MFMMPAAASPMRSHAALPLLRNRVGGLAPVYLFDICHLVMAGAMAPRAEGGASSIDSYPGIHTDVSRNVMGTGPHVAGGTWTTGVPST